MLVIIKGLLSGYSLYPSTIHKAQNAKVLCLFENATSSGPFFIFCTIFLCFDHSKSTMVATGPTRGELVTDMVNQ